MDSLLRVRHGQGLRGSAEVSLAALRDELPARIQMAVAPCVGSLCQDADRRLGLGNPQGLLDRRKVQFGQQCPRVDTLAASFGGMVNEVMCRSNVCHIAKVRYRHRERVLDFRIRIVAQSVRKTGDDSGQPRSSRREASKRPWDSRASATES